MIWAGIIGNELVGPFKVEDGVKIDLAGYTQFLEKNLRPWMKKKSATFKKIKGIYAGQRTPSCFQIHQRMVSEERHQRRPLDDLVTAEGTLKREPIIFHIPYSRLHSMLTTSDMRMIRLWWQKVWKI